MPRLVRWLRPLFAFLSFSLCILSIIAWKISYHTTVAAIPSTSASQAVLSKSLWPVHFNNARFSNVISFLSDGTGATIEIDWPAIEPLKIDRNTTVSTPNLDPSASFSTYSKQQRLGVCLASLLSSLNANLQFVAEGDTIRISARGAAKSDNGRELFPDPDVQFPRLRPPPRPKPHEFVLFHHRFTPVADHGTFRLWLTPADPAAVYQDGSNIGFATSPTSSFSVTRAGFSLKGARSPFNNYIVELPFWATTLLTAILPLLWLHRFIQRLRRSPNHCPNCNYDLRATPNLCPECGHIPSPLTIISSPPSFAHPASPPTGIA